MSLVQRVTSIEGTDRERPQLDNLVSGHLAAGYGTLRHSPYLRHEALQRKSLRHVISYDALARPDEQSRATNPTGGVTQYKISNLRRFAQVFFTVLSCWLASGIVFGFAALKPVLISEGVYRELCTTEETQAGIKVCYEQDLRLNIFFAIASTTSNVSALPVGTILDRYGPRVAGIIGSILLGIGTILMACAFHIPKFDGYMVGNVFLALGGSFIFLPSYAIANAFPKFSGTIVATITGAFDASAAVFLFYRLAYESSGGRFTPAKFFFCYLAVPIFILIGQLTLMNEDAYKTVSQLEIKIEKEQDATRDVHDSDEDIADKEVNLLKNARRAHRESKLQELENLVGGEEERQHRADKEEDRLAISGVWGALHGRSAMEQILTPWFIFLAILTVLQMLRMNFFIATIRAQYNAMLGSRKLGKKVNRFFDVALPIGGILATPFVGLLLDNISTATMLAVLTAMITAVGIADCIPFLWAAYLNVILFVLLRPLYYSAMSDYAAKIFGFATFGRVYGCIIALSGAINMFQPAIDAMNHDVFNDNPIPINAILASLGFLVGTSLVIYVSGQAKRLRREEEAREAGRNMVIDEEEESEYAISFLDLRSS